MNFNRISAVAVCVAIGLSAVSESSLAKRDRSKSSRSVATEQSSSGPSDNSTGYPNGRPFQAIEYDFDELNRRLGDIETDLETIGNNLIRVGQAVVRTEANTNTIITNLGTLDGKVDGIAEDLTMMKNTLDVQVSVEEATVEERNAGVDSDVILYVQVVRNGVGVEQLSADAFSYGNSFPAAAATYCGIDCFEEGIGGMYAIRLEVDESDNTFAGTLMVNDDDGAGTAGVSFDIPAAPVEPEPEPEPVI